MVVGELVVMDDKEPREWDEWDGAEALGQDESDDDDDGVRLVRSHSLRPCSHVTSRWGPEEGWTPQAQAQG